MSKLIHKIIYSYEKKSLTIFFKDGTAKGYIGDIAVKLSKKLSNIKPKK